MSTQVVPKEWLSGGLRTQMMPAGEGMWVECEVAHPPSRKGNTVFLYLSADHVTKLIPELRSSAIAARSRHEGSEG